MICWRTISISTEHFYRETAVEQISQIFQEGLGNIDFDWHHKSSGYDEKTRGVRWYNPAMAET